MNNPYFIFLIRRDHVLGLTVHLAAGILALVLLTGIARAENPAVSHPSVSSAVAGR
jgi:hypothetical protein